MLVWNLTEYTETEEVETSNVDAYWTLPTLNFA